MVEYQIPLIMSSNPANGASQISQNGSRFNIVFTRPLRVPVQAKYCWLTVENSTVIFNTPNILTDVNDKIRIIFNNGVDPILQYDLVIPKGLYDLEHLNETIKQQLTNQGGTPDAVVILPDTSTQKVVLKLRQFFQVDFTINESFRELLGFDSRLVPALPAIIDNQYENGDDIARFNSILYYLMHSDLCSGHGLRINNVYNDIIQQIPINVPAGSQIVYEPQNLTRIPCPNLIGQSLREITTWLTDDQNEPVDTLGEYFSCRVNIHYIM